MLPWMGGYGRYAAGGFSVSSVAAYAYLSVMRGLAGGGTLGRTAYKITHSAANRFDVYTGPTLVPRLTGTTFYCTNTNCITDASAVAIATPAAIFKHFALNWSGVASGDFTTGASVFGSFDDGDGDLAANVASSADYNLFLPVLQPMTYEEMGQILMSVAPMAFYRSCWDGKFKCPVEKAAPDTQDYFLDPDGTAYAWKYDEDMDIGSVSWGVTPVDAIINEVHVLYAAAPPNIDYTKDAYISPEGSDDGTGTEDQTGALGTATDRKAKAAASAADFAVRGKMEVRAPYIVDDAVAVALRNRIFDRLYWPKVVLRANLSQRAYGLEPMMATKIDNVLHDHIPCPHYPIPGGSKGNWNDLIFRTAGLDVSSNLAGRRITATFEQIL